MARQMVTKFGMSDLGLIALESQQQPVFLGNDSMQRSEYSEAISSRIDSQIRQIVMQCYENAKKIIRDNRSAIDRIADTLIEQETIEGKAFRKMVSELSDSAKSEESDLVVN